MAAATGPVFRISMPTGAGKTLLHLGEMIKGLRLSLETSKKDSPHRDFMPELIDAHRRENLTLVLGAGASAERGVLTWSTLLQELLIETIESSRKTPEQSRVLAWAFQSIFNPNPLVAARYLNRFYSKRYTDSPLTFTDRIRTSLYRGVRPSTEDGLMTEIRHLCMAVGKSPTP